MLGFNTLSGISSQIYTPKRYDEHPRHFYGGITSPPPENKLSSNKPICIIAQDFCWGLKCNVIGATCDGILSLQVPSVLNFGAASHITGAPSDFFL